MIRYGKLWCVVWCCVMCAHVLRDKHTSHTNAHTPHRYTSHKNTTHRKHIALAQCPTAKYTPYSHWPYTRTRTTDRTTPTTIPHPHPHPHHTPPLPPQPPPSLQTRQQTSPDQKSAGLRSRAAAPENVPAVGQRCPRRGCLPAPSPPKASRPHSAP